MWFASFISCELIVKVCVCAWQKAAMLVEETNNNTEICEVSKNIRAKNKHKPEIKTKTLKETGQVGKNIWKSSLSVKSMTAGHC